MCLLRSGKLQLITRKTANLYATFGIFIKRNVVNAKARKNKRDINEERKKRIKNENKQVADRVTLTTTRWHTHRLCIALNEHYTLSISRPHFNCFVRLFGWSVVVRLLFLQITILEIPFFQREHQETERKSEKKTAFNSQQNEENVHKHTQEQFV